MGLTTQILLVFGCVCLGYGYITWIEPRLPLPGERPAPGTPWPLPQELRNSSTVLTLSPDFFITQRFRDQCDVLIQAINRYTKIINPSGARGGSNLFVLQVAKIQIESCEEYPPVDMDETYSIIIKDQIAEAVIDAKSVWGALRALETFSQLIWDDKDLGTHLINETTINDFPRFKHRGLLLDSARHFIPLQTLKDNLDAMSYNKFNVFHWHLSDDQSFPIESKKFPNLTELGAYHPKLIYTQDQVRDIIEFARLRGIRVIPEIDSPGHTYALGRAFNEILSSCYGDGKTPDTARYPDFSAREILDPMNPQTYVVMKEIISEWQGLFRDPYIHLGMDEVYYACWNSSPIVAEFMKEKGFTQMHQFEEYYVTNIIKMVGELGYKYTIWQDPIENGVTAANDTIVQIWKDKELDPSMDYWRNYIVPIAKKGYKLLLSSCWYLNYISYGQDWKKYYTCDPQDFDATEEERALVIGGEAAVWGEYADGTNLIARLWPRASAVGERLWSSQSLNDTDSAAFRLDQLRCLLVKRGLPAQPILNGFCGDYEYGV